MGSAMRGQKGRLAPCLYHFWLSNKGNWYASGMKEAVEALDAEYSPALETFPLSLPREYRSALEAAAGRLTPDELRVWAETGVALAQQSLRSWESAAEYFRVTPQVLACHTIHVFQALVQLRTRLAVETPALATAYFRAAPDALAHLSVPQVEDWGALGRQLYKGTWKSSSLASQFFEITAQLVGQISVGEMRALVRFVDALSAKSYELAAACLAVAPRVLSSVPRADRGPISEFRIGHC